VPRVYWHRERRLEEKARGLKVEVLWIEEQTVRAEVFLN
jgi:hypothetical protein